MSYRVWEEFVIKIGSGAHSDVFLQSSSTTPVAVKRFSVIAGTADHKKAIFERLILENIRHPNLISSEKIHVSQKLVRVAVPAYNSYSPNYVELPELQYEIDMKYHRKGSLDRYLSILYQDSLVRDIAIEIFREVLTGLEHLHSHKIVHGSIKPDNILIDESGSVKLADFGGAVLTYDAQQVFGVAAKEIFCEGTSRVTQYDDLIFRNRPVHHGCVQLYDFFRSFDQGDVDEENMGLIALFTKMFKMDPQKSKTKHLPKPEDFYNTMVALHTERDQSEISICRRLLEHPFMQQKATREQLKLQKRMLFGGNILERPIRQELETIYSKRGMERLRNLNEISSRLLQQTPRGQISDLTNQPLSSRPPVGFQKTLIEFPLTKISSAELAKFESLTDKFLIHLNRNNRINALKENLCISSETYKLMKKNGNPKIPPFLSIGKDHKSVLQGMQEDGWKIIRIYGTEKPAIPSLEQVPRGYVAIEPGNGATRKVMIAFMGAEVLPRLPETWWTNDREMQTEIWSEVNFKRSHDKHTGLSEYAENMIFSVESELAKVLLDSKGQNIHFELTGHSTGGVLGILMAKRLKKLYPAADIHGILFATPAFMNLQESVDLQIEFPNDSHHSIFNIISLLDPALGIYGEGLHQPSFNTVFIAPPNFSGESFLDVHAASKGTTIANIDNHSIENYRFITSLLLRRNDQNLSRNLPGHLLPSKL